MSGVGNVTAGYRVLPGAGGNRYRFFCELSGIAVYTTPPLRAAGGESELAAAWERARPHFNRCPRCGRWVSDLMFHPAAGACVACAPWEDAPRFCPACGAAVRPGAGRCGVCGADLSDLGEEHDFSETRGQDL